MGWSNKDKAHGRNYKREYELYQGTEEQKKKRAQRNAARNALAKEGKVSKGDGNDVAHKRALSRGGTNSRKNLTTQPKAVNRAFSRNADGSMKKERSKNGR